MPYFLSKSFVFENQISIYSDSMSFGIDLCATLYSANVHVLLLSLLLNILTTEFGRSIISSVQEKHIHLIYGVGQSRFSVSSRISLLEWFVYSYSIHFRVRISKWVSFTLHIIAKTFKGLTRLNLKFTVFLVDLVYLCCFVFCKCRTTTVN